MQCNVCAHNPHNYNGPSLGGLFAEPESWFHFFYGNLSITFRNFLLSCCSQKLILTKLVHFSMFFTKVLITSALFSYFVVSMKSYFYRSKVKKFVLVYMIIDQTCVPCTMHGARGTRHVARGTVHGTRGTGHGARGTMHGARSTGTGHEARGTVHGARGTVHREQCTEHGARGTGQGARCTVYSALCTTCI